VTEPLGKVFAVGTKVVTLALAVALAVLAQTEP
jgi:hypothetical protein